eukprot:1419672-Pyramimonas_sp.AAC.1
MSTDDSDVFSDVFSFLWTSFRRDEGSTSGRASGMSSCRSPRCNSGKRAWHGYALFLACYSRYLLALGMPKCHVGYLAVATCVRALLR